MSDRVLPGLEEWVREHPPKPGSKTTKPNGYASHPGSGPDGETCGSCAYIVRFRQSTSWSKCELFRQFRGWTGGRGTDVLVRSPACHRWKEVTDDS